MNDRTFGEDLSFLQQHTRPIVLRNDEDAALIVVPEYQGRTMTSTSDGDRGKSYGYLNYDAIASPSIDPKINLYGGEDRVWISPEGGQYSIFFEPGVDMTFANWRTPPELDTIAFETLAASEASATFGKDARFTNWSGTHFDVRIERKVILLNRDQASQHLGHAVEGIQLCAHESRNTLINRGPTPWRAESGLIGIWMLCMSKPSPQATLLVPFRKTSDEDLSHVGNESIVTSDYFGELGNDRLNIDRDHQLIFFKGDGQFRSKLGLGFGRVTSKLGSWDALRGILTVVEFNLPDAAPHGYNNNLWEMQDQPYVGDVINCYNDGLNESGSSLAQGGFYELETISPALALEPGESYTHVHRTVRMEGQRSALNQIAIATFGIDLQRIESQR